MYHRTPHNNVKNILKEGLNCNDNGFICLSFNADSWWDECALFMVNIVGLKPNHIKIWPLDETDEMCLWIDSIAPERLTLIMEEPE